MNGPNWPFLVSIPPIPRSLPSPGLIDIFKIPRANRCERLIAATMDDAGLARLLESPTSSLCGEFLSGNGGTIQLI